MVLGEFCELLAILILDIVVPSGSHVHSGEVLLIGLFPELVSAGEEALRSAHTYQIILP